jgi:hypothetical protein
VQPLVLDITGALSAAVGAEHGVQESELEALREPSARAVKSVQGRRGTDLRWLDLPYQ